MKNFIVVAGVNYKDTKHSVFYNLAENRSNYWKRKYRGEAITITIFDFHTGINQQTIIEKGKASTKRIKKYDQVTEKNYEKTKSGEIRFKDGQPGVMSIADVYHFIEKLGRGDQKGTLAELSIFSHAYVIGPILVNSVDDRLHTQKDGSKVLALSGERDNDDKDGRAERDFRERYVLQKELRDAFQKDGFAWIWGCTFTPYIVQMFTAIFGKDNNYKRAGLSDEEVFILKLDQVVVKELLERYPTLDTAGNTIRIRFGDLRMFFWREYQFCYCNYLALYAGIKVYGAPPGTGSDFAGQFMKIVDRKGRNKDTLEFYKNYLKITSDPEGYNYVLFNSVRPTFPSN